MLKSFRYLLFPFSLVYGAAVLLRNYLYDKKMLKSAAFNFPVICVGNLATGGTGKTPMTEYLVSILKKRYQPATLSRGYKRKTKGFAIANEKTTALEIGDEPMQLHERFPDVAVAVGEERLVAIPRLLQERPDTEVIILDDAFQHRAVRAGLNIVLTEFKNLYTRDLMIPAGDLRDTKTSMARAHIVVVTKCPVDLSVVRAEALRQEFGLREDQQLFFATLEYSEPTHLFTGRPGLIDAESEVLLVTGIANPKPLKELLTATVHSYDMIRYLDHHIFTSTDLADIKKHLKRLSPEKRILLTTEKDGVRLRKFESELIDEPVYVLPVAHRFLFDAAGAFENAVFNYVAGFKSMVYESIQP